MLQRVEPPEDGGGAKFPKQFWANPPAANRLALSLLAASAFMCVLAAVPWYLRQIMAATEELGAPFWLGMLVALSCPFALVPVISFATFHLRRVLRLRAAAGDE